jgi:hypothetical protein
MVMVNAMSEGIEGGMVMGDKRNKGQQPKDA